MGRTTRQYIPGVAFHITARTQGEVAWFTDSLSERIERILLEGIASSDARLISHSVMPNHFHLVLRQSTRSLGWIMQPIMRRIALLVHNTHDVAGHVFERRFHSKPCENGLHLRRATIYTNLNRARAKLCSINGTQPWCSYDVYANEMPASQLIDVPHVLSLFAEKVGASVAENRAVYQRYVDWRLAKDVADEAGVACLVPEPICAAGDMYFAQHFCALPIIDTRPQYDLRDAACIVLRCINPAIPISRLRKSYVSRADSAVRNEIIAALSQQGYQGSCIADFFRVSNTVVARVVVQMRYGNARP